MSARTTRRCDSCRRQATVLFAVRTTGAGPDARTSRRTGDPVRTSKRFRACGGCAVLARTTAAPVRELTDRTTDTRTGTGRRLAPVASGPQLAGGVA